MDQATIDALNAELIGQLGRPVTRTEPVRVWAMSGVQRLHTSSGSVIFKFAREPFTDEARILHHVADQGLPVPRLLASTLHEDAAGMLLEDLGPTAREPTLREGAAAAAATHATPPPHGLPVLDTAALAALPGRAGEHLDALRSGGRWSDTDDITDRLQALEAIAGQRARGAETPPFGLCHSEFHPTSLHVGAHGRWRLLDFARAFKGPGLLDLASWQGTTTAPDLAALRDLLLTYVAAGGHDQALADRGGLTAESWAIGWHRLWAIEWYLEQALRWIPDPGRDAATQTVLRRHLDEAVQCLRA